MTEREKELSDLLHEVYSRGSAIQEAADLMEKASPEERREMLRLMEQQARNLADSISQYANGRRSKEALAA